VSDTELERMVVTLDGDMEGYKAMAEEAKQETTVLSRNMEHHAGAVEHLSHKVEGFGESVVAALEALGVEHFLHSSLDEFQEAEEGMHKLEAALMSNGREVEKLKEDYSEFAGNIQRTTTMSDDAMINLLRMAETFELTGDNAKAAAVNAQAIAAVTGGSAQSYIRFSAALQKGDTATAMRMARMIPQLRGVKDGAEFAAKAQRLLQTGMQMVHKEAESSSGSLKMLSNLWGDFKEDLGGVVAEGLKPLVEYGKEASLLIKDLTPETKKLLVQAMAVGAGLIMLGPTLSLLGVVFGPLVSGAATLLPLLGLLANPVTLAVGAIALLSSYFVDWKSIASDALQWVDRQWHDLIDHFTPAYEGIRNALAAGDLELAFRIVTKQLEADWAEFNVKFTEYWNATKDVFVDGWFETEATIEIGWIDFLTYLRSNWKAAFEGIMYGFKLIAQATGDDEFARNIDAALAAPVDTWNTAAKEAQKSIRSTQRMQEDARRASRAADLEDAKKAAKDAQKALDDSIDDAFWEKFWADFDKEEADALGTDIKPKPGKEPKIDAKVVPKFDAADFRSAEAMFRVQEFATNMTMQMEGKGKKEPDANTPILEDIRDELKDRNDGIGVADLG
jgi:hypothetical protein